eukprot:3833928-Rhodomonas_salina.2
MTTVAKPNSSPASSSASEGLRECVSPIPAGTTTSSSPSPSRVEGQIAPTRKQTSAVFIEAEALTVDSFETKRFGSGGGVVAHNKTFADLYLCLSLFQLKENALGKNVKKSSSDTEVISRGLLNVEHNVSKQHTESHRRRYPVENREAYCLNPQARVECSGDQVPTYVSAQLRYKMHVPDIVFCATRFSRARPLRSIASTA